jgi:hypothetical protein
MPWRPRAPPLSRQSFGLIDKHRKKPRLGHCVAQINAIFVGTPKISFYCAIGIFLKQMAEDHDQKKNVNFISLFVFIPSWISVQRETYCQKPVSVRSFKWSIIFSMHHRCGPLSPLQNNIFQSKL